MNYSEHIEHGFKVGGDEDQLKDFVLLMREGAMAMGVDLPNFLGDIVFTIEVVLGLIEDPEPQKKMDEEDLWSMINEINSDMDEGRLTHEEGIPRLRNICKEYLKDTETEKRHALQDVEFGEVVIWTVPQILEEINRDRSGEWEDYNETDWQDGLSMTNYKYLGEVK